MLKGRVPGKGAPHVPSTRIAASLRPVSALLLTLGLMAGCGDHTSPVSPAGIAEKVSNGPLMVSGHVYAQASSAGEPAVAEAVITLRDARGEERTALSDHPGFLLHPGDAW